MAEATIPDRVRWAVDQLRLQPDARVLEIGGGPGAAAELICPQLAQGWLLNLDRSATAIERARRRNQAHLDSGRLRLQQGELRALDIPEGSVDVAFSLNVNLFWTGPADVELGRLFRALVPGGRLLILYGPSPAGSDQRRVLTQVRDAVAASPFGTASVWAEARGAGVIALRPPL
ncbi:MAG TPA: class I SAM-dependent methyltransferase [Propionibacteriaceae bacterium]|nr:class I SAM-dependent methyltransferase [Propionibacteriaceae bacterium]